jgi:Aerotolerance regulator N-terminal/von Willebrand factor type A domain
MAFLNPIFLLGALAATLPVLVHLVRRTRASKLQFPSLMFLRRIEQKTIRKRRLRNWLLLALRCAALLLLALAFARPYFSGASAASTASNVTSSVILIDASYSMRYGDVFNRARQAARNVINESPSSEQFAVVQFSRSYDVLVPMKPNRDEALAAVAQMQPGLGATDYLQAVQAAISLLKDASGAKRIHLISDFQDAGWNRNAPPVKLPADIKLNTIDVADARPSNLAVLDVKAEPVVYQQKYAGKLIARVANFGAEPVSNATVDFKLNDLTVERRQLKLDANEQGIVEFSGFNVPEGANRASVEITGDAFTLDDKSFFTIRREDQSKVLVIDTATRGRSESFFLQQSLAAGENNQYALTTKTAGTTSPAELESYRVVIVNDAGGISDGLAAAIKAFAERGGGVILAAGRHTDAGEFNRAFTGFAPAQIGETVQSRSYALMSQLKSDHPIFAPFQRGGRLASTRVYGYHRATANDGATTIAALDDGNPVIVDGLAGRGKVLLITTTLDTAWNDLPLTPMFLPLARQMLEYLGGRELSAAYTIGQVIAAPPDTDGSLPAIDNPAGGRLTDARQNPTGELAFDATEIGYYKFRYRNRNEFAAVNLDAKESDFAKLNLDDFVASLTREPGDRDVPPVQSPRVTAEEIEARQRLWLPLLLLSLALFIAEATLARRIRIAKLVG